MLVMLVYGPLENQSLNTNTFTRSANNINILLLLCTSGKVAYIEQLSFLYNLKKESQPRQESPTINMEE